MVAYLNLSGLRSDVFQVRHTELFIEPASLKTDQTTKSANHIERLQKRSSQILRQLFDRNIGIQQASRLKSKHLQYHATVSMHTNICDVCKYMRLGMI